MKTKHRRIDAGGDDHEPHLSPEKEKTGGDVGGEHDVDHEAHLSPEKEKTAGDEQSQKVKCPHCSLSLASRGSLQKHIKLKHSTPSFICDQCGQGFTRKDYFERHKCAGPSTKIKTRINVEEEEEPRVENDESREQSSAFNRMLLTREWRIRGATDPLSLMAKYHSALKRSLISVLVKHAAKMYINVEISMVRKDQFGIKERAKTYFQGSTRILLRASQIPEMLQSSTEKINQSFDEFLRDGSGWILESIDYLRLYTAEYAPMQGKSYIPTPSSIVNKKAIVNIQNEDDKCFEYAIIASQHYSEIDDCNKSCRPGQYTKWLGKYKFSGCQQPMTVDDIHKFEKANQMAINVYHIKSDGKLITPLRITQKEVKLEDFVNLLLIEGEKDCHYAWIRNLDRLLSYGDHNQRKFCPFCLQGFDKRGKKTLEEHLELCREYGGQKTVLPTKDKNIIEFTDHHKW
jgi:transposase-like protein